MSNVEYMPLTPVNGITVAQWLGGKGITASVEPDDRLRVSITEQVSVGAAPGLADKIDKVETDVLVRPGLFVVATYVEAEKRYFLRVTSKVPKPGEDESTSDS